MGEPIMIAANERQVGGDHYASSTGVQHWDLFGADYLIGYAVKYMRWRKKGGVEDLEKAIHVIEKLREEYKVGQGAGRQRPDYDTQLVAAWCDGVGLDWVERTIVNRLMFGDFHSDLDDAIAGIRHLIAGAPSAGELQLGKLAKTAGLVTKYEEMTNDELRAERARLEAANAAAPGWGAAVGARHEGIREIDSLLARRERRVPRHVSDTPSCGDGSFDARMRRAHEVLGDPHDHVDAPRQRTPKDGAQHSSLYPWAMTPDRYCEVFVWRTEHATKFYTRRGEWMLLDEHVETEKIPREIANCYDYYGTSRGGYTLRIADLPADLRERYPVLPLEQNAVEHGQVPIWQAAMYEWKEEKWKLRSEYAAWGPEQ